MIKLNLALKALIFLSVVIFMDSCRSEDNFSGTVETFTITSEIFNSFNKNFIVVSNQDGLVLFDNVGTDLTGTIQLDVPQSDKIDVTYGYEHDFGFQIYTYRDIASEFLLSSRNYDCNNELIPETSEALRFFTLEITGISSYSELYYPFLNKEDVEIGADKIILRGSINNTNDLVVTILPENSSDYKTIHLKDEDWIAQEEPNFFRSVAFEDFVTPEIHEIDLGMDAKWMVKAKIKTQQGRLVNLSDWTTYNDYQNGSKAKLFLTPEINVESIRLEIRNGNVHDGQTYLRTTSQIPNQINFFSPEITFGNIDEFEYSIEVDEPCSLSMIEYHYSQNNWLSKWRIYQKFAIPITNQLITIPDEFLTQSSILSSLIDSPERVVAKFYQIENESFQEMYDNTGIDRQLNCLEYKSRYLNKDF